MGEQAPERAAPAWGRLCRIRAASAMLLCALLGQAVAQETETVQLLLGGSATHDSNLFRLPDSVDAQAAGRPGRSDTVDSAYVGLRVDKPYSLQRLQLDVRKTANRYRKFSELDFDSLSYRGAWLWRVTPRVGGTLSAERSETLVPFSDFEGTQRNVRKREGSAFTLDAALRGPWHLSLGVSRSKQTSSVPVALEADFDSTQAEIGGRYLARSGSLLGFVHRVNDGDYLNRTASLGDSFTERQNELQASWIASGRSTIGARLTWLDRRHHNLPDRDFDAVAASLTHSWIVTGRVQLNFAAQRDISAALDPLARFTRRDAVHVGPTWQATGKTTVRVQLGRVHADYGSAGSSAGREDKTDVGEVALEWAAMRNLRLSARVLGERRASNEPGLDYEATVTSLAASLTF